MENELLILRAGREDIHTVSSLARAIWPITYKDILSAEQIDYMMELFYSAQSLQEQLTKDAFLLAKLNEEPVGFASYSPSKEPDIYKLHKIYVKPGLQGRGLGKALIRYIMQDIMASGAKALDLNVNRFNKARYFYEKMGFAIIREEDIDIGNGYQMNDYVMRLPAAG